MTHKFGNLRRFRFNLPRRIAACLLLCFLAQGLWLIAHAAPSLSSACTRILSCSPFLAIACLLGGALWWVTRRMYGNLGGYMALALYCFSPAILKASVSPSPELIATLGIYAGLYTSIGVAHAMQGPRRKWRPRILLLSAAYALAAAAHIAALPILALAGLAFMLWVAEDRRAQVFPVVFFATLVALVGVFLGNILLPQFFDPGLGFPAGLPRFSLDAVRAFFTLPHLGILLASSIALALYLAQPRSRYFGNTVPLLCTLFCMTLIMPAAPSWLWAVPFLLTFIAGLFADAFEGTRPRLAIVVAVALVLLQIAASIVSLSS